MNIYIIHGVTSYGRGMAVVAAKSPNRAKMLLGKTGYPWNDPQWALEIVSCKCLRGASIDRVNPAVLSQSSYIE